MEWIIAIVVPLYIALGCAVATLQMIPFRDQKKFDTPTGKFALALFWIFIALAYPFWLIYVGFQLSPRVRTKKLMEKIAHDPNRNNVLRKLDQAHTGKAYHAPEKLPRPHRAQAEFIGSKSRYVLENRHQHRRTED